MRDAKRVTRCVSLGLNAAATADAPESDDTKKESLEEKKRVQPDARVGRTRGRADGEKGGATFLDSHRQVASQPRTSRSAMGNGNR